MKRTAKNPKIFVGEKQPVDVRRELEKIVAAGASDLVFVTEALVTWVGQVTTIALAVVANTSIKAAISLAAAAALLLW